MECLKSKKNIMLLLCFEILKTYCFLETKATKENSSNSDNETKDSKESNEKTENEAAASSADFAEGKDEGKEKLIFNMKPEQAHRLFALSAVTFGISLFLLTYHHVSTG